MFLPMTADDVVQKVEAEIGENWHVSNGHGIDLRKCLVRPPVLLEFKNSWYQWAGKVDPTNRLLSSATLNLWLVLLERPDTGKGYAIVYDEAADSFGLAGAADRIFDGHYGTFLETLEAM